MLRGDKTIPYRGIVAVQLKKAGLTAGYIQLTLMGGPEAKRGLFQSTMDENTVNFHNRGDINKRFEHARRLIEERIGEAWNSPAKGTEGSDNLDQLEKLAKLRDQGIVTDEEFEAKKKALLGLASVVSSGAQTTGPTGPDLGTPSLPAGSRKGGKRRVLRYGLAALLVLATAGSVMEGAATFLLWAAATILAVSFLIGVRGLTERLPLKGGIKPWTYGSLAFVLFWMGAALSPQKDNPAVPSSPFPTPATALLASPEAAKRTNQDATANSTAPTATATPRPTQTPKPTATPSPTPPPKDLQGALDSVIDVLNEANKTGQVYFKSANIKEGGARLEVTVTDLWYLLPQFQKERFVETVADLYAVSAASHGLRGANPGEANYPTTSFVDTFGKEVAYKSTWRTEVKR